MEIIKAYEFFGQFNVDYYEFTYSVDTSDENSSELYTEQMKLVAELAPLPLVTRMRAPLAKNVLNENGTLVADKFQLPAAAPPPAFIVTPMTAFSVRAVKLTSSVAVVSEPRVPN